MAPRSNSFAPYPQDDPKNIPLEQWAAMPPWFKDIRPDDQEEWAECHLPELSDCDTLPLAYWEGLFYAIIAEIQYLYQDLQHRYGERFELGKTRFHDEECAHCAGHAFCVADFAQLLETCWVKITSVHLTAALDYAIMQRASFLANGETPTFYSMMRFQGLYDVNPMEPIEIIRWLADKHAAEIKVAVRSNMHDIPGLLEAYDAARVCRDERKAQREQTEKALIGPQSESQKEDTLRDTPVPSRRPVLNMIQTPIDSNLQRSATEVPNFQRRGVVRKPSNLALASEKSFASTNLNRDQSVQRHPQEVTTPHTEKACTSPAIFEPMCHASSTPAPEPNPLISPDDEGLFMKQSHSSGRVGHTSTQPSMQCQTSPETQPTSPVHASFDSMAHSKKFKLSTRTTSFPAFDDTRPLPLPPQEQQDNRDEQAGDASFPILKPGIRPRPSTSPSTPPPNVYVASRSQTLPTGPAPFGQQDQLQPVPRQKTDGQRYVPAGGHTPLHERDVMADFRLPVDENEQQATFSMKKEDLFTQLDTRTQLEGISREEGARKVSMTASEKKERSFMDRVRVFSRKSSKNEYEG